MHSPELFTQDTPAQACMNSEMLILTTEANNQEEAVQKITTEMNNLRRGVVDLEKKINQLTSITSTSSREINTLKKVVISLIICFIIFIIYSYGVFRSENEKIYFFNKHMDYTIGYIQDFKDNLDKTLEFLKEIKEIHN
jgi:hypothetical protein